MTNYTLMITIFLCAGVMLLCGKKEKRENQWNGKFQPQDKNKHYKLKLQQKNDKEIELTIDAGEKGKLENAVALLIEDDTAIYDDGDGVTLIMRMEDGELKVTQELGKPYVFYDRLAS